MILLHSLPVEDEVNFSTSTTSIFGCKGKFSLVSSNGKITFRSIKLLHNHIQFVLKRMNNKVSIEYAFTPTSLVNIKMWNDKLHWKVFRNSMTISKVCMAQTVIKAMRAVITELTSTSVCSNATFRILSCQKKGK